MPKFYKEGNRPQDPVMNRAEKAAAMWADDSSQGLRYMGEAYMAPGERPTAAQREAFYEAQKRARFGGPMVYGKGASGVGTLEYATNGNGGTAPADPAQAPTTLRQNPVAAVEQGTNLVSDSSKAPTSTAPAAPAAPAAPGTDFAPNVQNRVASMQDQVLYGLPPTPQGPGSSPATRQQLRDIRSSSPIPRRSPTAPASGMDDAPPARPPSAGGFDPAPQAGFRTPPARRQPSTRQRLKSIRSQSQIPQAQSLRRPDYLGMSKGGQVKVMKMKQPGYMHGGKVKMPKGYAAGGKVDYGYATGGAIGDVSDDMGQDTIDAKVRPGEYMLNPETVAYMGDGDYDQGVRMLDQTVRDATGMEPGPTPMRDGDMGFRLSGLVDAFGNEIAGPRPQWRSPGAANRPLSAEAAEYEAQRQARATPTQTVDRTVETPKQPRKMSMQSFRAALNTGGSGATVGGTIGSGVRGVGRAVGGFGNVVKGAPIVSALYGGGEGVYRGMNTSTQDYRERLGMSPELDDGWGDLAARAGGVLTDVGAGFANAWSAPYKVFNPDAPSFRDRFADVRSDKREAEQATILNMQSQLQDYALQELGISPDDAAAGNVPPGFDEAMAKLYSHVNGDGSVTPGAFDALNELAGRDLRTGVPLEGSGSLEYITDEGFRGGYTFPGSEPDTYYRPFTNEQVDPRDMNVVMTTDRGDKIVQEVGPNGEPMFSNLRSTPFRPEAEYIAEREEAAKAKAAESITSTGLARAGDIEGAKAMRVAEMEAAARGAGSTSKAITAARNQIDERFQMPVYDDEGKVKDYIDDKDAKDFFYDTMSELGINPYALSPEQLDGAIKDILPIYQDVRMAQEQVSDRFDVTTSDSPRTGAQAIRRMPGSNIGLGDVFGGRATLGEYGAGVFNQGDFYDEFVEDPVSGLRFPATAAATDPRTGNIDLEALRRYGYGDSDI